VRLTDVAAAELPRKITMRKRTLIIVASSIVIIGLLVGGYIFFFSSSAELTVTDDPFGGLEGDLAGGLEEMDQGAGTEVAPRFLRISDRPVAEGAVAFTFVATTTVTVETASGTPELAETTTTDTEIRFIDRASGNIYRFRAHERSLVRITNKTLPGVQQASWLPDGSVAYARFLQDVSGTEQVATYVLPATGEGQGGFFLEQGLAQATVTGSSTLFTLLSGTTGSVGSVSRSDGTNARTLFTSPLASLLVRPARENFFAYTKASFALDGYAFQINATSGGFSRILGPARGLSVLPSPDGSRVLYSYLDRGTIRLAVFDMTSRSSTALPVATLTEKCAWVSDGSGVYCGVPTSLSQGLPDFWYQGAAVFTDRIWRIDMQERLATLVVDPRAVADVSIDAVALTTDPAEDVLVFTDKHTGTLWSYDL
jgi:hypothetical protein